VLVVLASPDDHAARALVARWGRERAGLLTCADLSHSGWRHELGTGGTGRSTAVVDGRLVETEAISGVLTLLPWVLPNELDQIIPGDREYVAQEMTAFLLAWLTQLPCPVLNRPTTTSLAGPSWPVERWRHLAAHAGLRAAPIRRRADPAASAGAEPLPVPAVASVTVIGDRCVGDVPALAAQARRLAAVAGAELLTVYFDRADASASVLLADPRPPVSDRRVADAILAHFQQAGPARAATGAGR
jgi:hypothetical protein